MPPIVFIPLPIDPPCACVSEDALLNSLTPALAPGCCGSSLKLPRPFIPLELAMPCPPIPFIPL